MLITLLARDPLCIFQWGSYILFTPILCSFKINFNIILPSTPDSSCDVFPSVLLALFFMNFLSPPVHSSRPTLLMLRGLITLIMSGEESKL